MRLGQAARGAGNAREEGEDGLVLGWVGGFGGGDNSQLYKKRLLHCLAASPYNLESQASQTEDVQSLPKEIEQREIEVKKAGTRERERGERWEVKREEDRVGEVVRVWTLGVVQRSLIVDPCF